MLLCHTVSFVVVPTAFHYCRIVLVISSYRPLLIQLAQPATVERLKPRSPVIKVEEDELWERNTDPQKSPKQFTGSTDEGQRDGRDEPQISKHEVSAEATITSCSWVDGETNNSPILISDPKTLNSNKRASNPLLENSVGIPEPVVFNCVTFEPQIHHATHGTQNPLIDDAGCSYSLNTNINIAAPSNLGAEFPYTIGELGHPLNEHQQNTDFVNSRQRVALPASEAPLTDGKDGATVSNALVLRDDWVSHDNYSNVPGYEQDDAGGKIFICSFCGKTLACLKNLKTHMRVHTGEKPFGCVQCGKRFSDSSNLKRHQSVHTGERRYCCIHCGKRFAQSGSLKVHMSVHSGCKQFKCPHCGKTFISANHLRRHVSVHDGEKQLEMSLQ